jgi:putative ABC transport system permease protein
VQRGRQILDVLSRDIVYALRGLRRAPGLTTTILLSFAFGMGANVAIFAVLDRIVFQAPPGVTDPRSVRRIYAQGPGVTRSSFITHFSLPALLDFANGIPGPTRFEGYELLSDRSLDDGVARINVSYVTSGYFEMLGIRPSMGRFFVTDENRIGDARNVAVISDGLWRRNFGESRSIIGQTIRIDSISFTIVGVAQKAFEGLDLDVVHVWAPLSSRPAGSEPTALYDRGSRNLDVLARVTRGTDLRALEARMSTEYVRANGVIADFGDSLRIITAPLLQSRGPVRFGSQDERNLSLAKRLAVVGIAILLVAVVNVASLLLMRTIRRRQEIAVRFALGASRWRLIAQLVSETMLLAAGGGMLALVVGWWGGSFLRTTLLSNIRWSAAPHAERAVLLTVALTVAGGLVVGLLPAFFAARNRPLDALRADSLGIDQTGSKLRFALLITQTSLCLALLSCAGAFLQSLRRASNTDAGFEPTELVTVDATGRRMSASQLEEGMTTFRSLPGVRAVANASADIRVGMQGAQLASAGDLTLPTAVPVSVNYVDSSYFRAAGIRVLTGRGIDARDVQGSERVAVVTEAAAKEFWGNSNSVGSCLTLSQNPSKCQRVVGVVRDVRWDLTERARPHIFVPLSQVPPRYGHFFVIRTQATSSAMLASLNRAAAESFGMQPRAPNVQRVDDRLAPLTKPWRAAAALFLLFGVLALIAAATGIYGLVAYDIALRTREIGIRIVMGARPRDILTVVVGSASRAVAIGITIGLLGAVAAGRSVAAFLFETSPYDPLILCVAIMTLVAAAGAASLIPARRTLQIEPASALRAE